MLIKAHSVYLLSMLNASVSCMVLAKQATVVAPAANMNCVTVALKEISIHI